MKISGGVRNVGTMFHGHPTTPMVAAVANNSSQPSSVVRGIGRTHLRMAVGRGTIGMTVAICSQPSPACWWFQLAVA
jgi:hypothetical protein